MKKLIAAVAMIFMAGSAMAALTADMKLSQEGDKILANIVVKQSGTTWQDGKVVVEWTAPAEKFCQDSKIELSYKASDRYRTKANRTVIIPIKGTDCVAVCDGQWTVRVLNEGVEVANGTLVVGKEATKPEVKPEAKK